jgi:hypothetical protein
MDNSQVMALKSEKMSKKSTFSTQSGAKLGSNFLKYIFRYSFYYILTEKYHFTIGFPKNFRSRAV